MYNCMYMYDSQEKNRERTTVDESRWEHMHESFRPNESKSLNSRQLSSSFGPVLKWVNSLGTTYLFRIGFWFAKLQSVRC